MRNVWLFLQHKVHASGFDGLLVCVLLIVGTFSLKKVIKMLEEVVVIWQEVRWIWRMRQNFVAQIVQHLKCWSCDMWSAVVEENWALYVHQCWLEAFQFSVHLINLPSILLRYNGFTGIQKTEVDQIGSKPPNSGPDLFLVQFWPWDVLWGFFSVQSLS